MYVPGWARLGAGSGPRQGRQWAHCPAKPTGPSSRQGWEVVAGSLGGRACRAWVWLQVRGELCHWSRPVLFCHQQPRSGPLTPPLSPMPSQCRRPSVLCPDSKGSPEAPFGPKEA